MKKEVRFREVIAYFEKERPLAKSELDYSTPYQLLVAVILSAQCTDKRVNSITPALFARYPNPYALAQATPEEVFSYIHSISYPNNKSKHLVAMAQKLVRDYEGEVPSEEEKLLSLAGVGRKTANVIASVIFSLPKMAVDTHVFRVSARIGLTSKAKNPTQAEQQLMRYIPENKVAIAHHWLILHGRYVCTARKPKCELCGLQAVCLYFQRGRAKEITKHFSEQGGF